MITGWIINPNISWNYHALTLKIEKKYACIIYVTQKEMIGIPRLFWRTSYGIKAFVVCVFSDCLYLVLSY